MTIKLDGTNGITNVNGTAAAPAETGTTSTNTGLSFGTNTVTVSTAGSARATFDASGNLGIGTTSPAAKLDVSTSINLGLNYLNIAYDVGGGSGWVSGYNTTYNAGVKNVNTGTLNSIYYASDSVRVYTNASAAAGTAASERMRIDSSGNVGIGTTTPNSAGVNRALTINGSTESIVELNFGGNRGGYLYSNQYNTVLSSVYTGAIIKFNTNDTTRMSIDANGIVTGTAGNLMLVQNTSRITLSSTATVISTAIPSWAVRIVVNIVGMTTSGTSDYIVQIGSGSYTATGYLGSGVATATSGAARTATTGFVIINNDGASQVTHATMVINLQNAATYTWSSSHSGGGSNRAQVFAGGGSVSLAGVLDRLRITTVNGTDTFSAGTINFKYE